MSSVVEIPAASEPDSWEAYEELLADRPFNPIGSHCSSSDTEGAELVTPLKVIPLISRLSTTENALMKSSKAPSPAHPNAAAVSTTAQAGGTTVLFEAAKLSTMLGR